MENFSFRRAGGSSSNSPPPPPPPPLTPEQQAEADRFRKQFYIVGAITAGSLFIGIALLVLIVWGGEKIYAYFKK